MNVRTLLTVTWLLAMLVPFPASPSSSGERVEIPVPHAQQTLMLASDEKILDCKKYPLTPRKPDRNWCALAFSRGPAVLEIKKPSSEGPDLSYAHGTRRIPSQTVPDRYGILGTVDDRTAGLRAWPMKTIPYWIESDGKTADLLPDSNMVENALCQWQQTTPVRFRLAKGNDPDERVLRFFSDNKSPIAQKRKVKHEYLNQCATYGRDIPYSNTIVMGSCNDPTSERAKGSVVHEVGHALALMHEHMQKGRDDYLDIDFVEMQKAYKKTGQPGNIVAQYYIDLERKTLGAKFPADSDYDFASIMHYAQKEYMKVKVDPKSKKIVEQAQKLLVKEKIQTGQIGQRDCVSERDAAAIIFLYKNKGDIAP